MVSLLTTTFGCQLLAQAGSLCNHFWGQMIDAASGWCQKMPDSQKGPRVERSDTATAQLKFRVRETLRQALENAAAANERPMNKEITARLEASFREETAWGGPRTASFLRLIAANIEAIETESEAKWYADYATWHAVKEMIPTLVARYRPPLPNEAAVLETAVHEVSIREEIGKVTQELLQLGVAVDPLKSAFGETATYVPRKPDEKTLADMSPEQAAQANNAWARYEALQQEREPAYRASKAALEDAIEAQRRGKAIAIALIEADNQQIIDGNPVQGS
jgi:hypothetical protein